MTDEPFLSRWSRRKNESRVAPEPELAPAVAAEQVEQPAPMAVAQPLPPVESLTPDSDFTGFMKPEVDEELKRRALKTLFQDPHFNVMDGLDTYIDDYSKPDPLPEGWLAQLRQVARLGDYQEPKAEGEANPPENTGTVPAPDAPEPEKPLTQQGFAEGSPVYESDTPEWRNPAIAGEGIRPFRTLLVRVSLGVNSPS